jgi:hypothetical protein
MNEHISSFKSLPLNAHLKSSEYIKICIITIFKIKLHANFVLVENKLTKIFYVIGELSSFLIDK